MYEFEIRIWCDSLDPSDSICFYFGDNTNTMLAGSAAVSQISVAGILPPNYSNVQEVVWRITHNYPGQGSYFHYVACIDRVSGITNIPNSSTTNIFLGSQFIIDPAIGCNSAPSNMNVSYMFFPLMSQSNTYALNYFDLDGDSLSYSFIACVEPGYNFPDFSGGGNLIMNPATGQFSWNSPAVQGIYNVVIRVEEWKSFSNNTVISIGFHEQEIQFIVDAANGIEQQVAQISVSLFPNPAIDNISFLVNGIDPSEIIITDQFGREVHRHKSIGETRFEISVADLADGMYFYQYIENSERKSSGKFIVKH